MSVDLPLPPSGFAENCTQSKAAAMAQNKCQLHLEPQGMMLQSLLPLPTPEISGLLMTDEITVITDHSNQSPAPARQRSSRAGSAFGAS